jgi:hypothetical protein
MADNFKYEGWINTAPAPDAVVAEPDPVAEPAPEPERTRGTWIETEYRGYKSSYMLITDPLGTSKDRDKRARAIPEQWRKVHGRRMVSMPRQPAVKANPPDAGADRDVADIRATIAERAVEYWEERGNGPESVAAARDRVQGRHVTPWHRITTASGHMAELTREPAPAGAELLRLGLPDPEGEPLAMLGAEFWRAYSRVRVCRPRPAKGPERVTLTFDAGGVAISAEDTTDHDAEVSAREYVALGTSLSGEPADTGPMVHVASFDDRLFWALRGRVYFMRHGRRAPAAKQAIGPAWLEDASGLIVVIMPLAE